MASVAAMQGSAPQRWKIETGKSAPLAAGTNLLGASYDDAGALLPQGGVPGVQREPDIRRAVTQALGALAVLSERSRCVLGQSLMGTFVDPVAEPVVVAASKPVNRALARAMGCGSRQAIGFMVR